MDNAVNFGKIIRNKRLSLNMPMSELARKVGVSRATLSSIENGNVNISVKTLLDILSILDIDFVIDKQSNKVHRSRASRINSVRDKNINRFVVMCVEQFANYSGKSSKETYIKFAQAKIIKELEDDYDDLHGMSTVYLNEYIATYLGHQLAK